MQTQEAQLILSAVGALLTLAVFVVNLQIRAAMREMETSIKEWARETFMPRHRPHHGRSFEESME